MNTRSRVWISLAWLGLVHAAILCAGFLAPSDPQQQDREHPFAPPMRLHVLDSAGRFHLRPFVYELVRPDPDNGGYEEDRSNMHPLRFFVVGARSNAFLTPPDRHLFGIDAPGHVFLLGTDGFGRDQFSRLLYGGRFSLFAGFAAATLSLGIGLLLGSLSGYYGGWFDEAAMRGAELLLVLPWLYCLLALRAFLPLHITSWQTFLLLVLVMGLRGWARPARLIRGAVLSAREREYVIAARGFGAGTTYLLRRHIIPQTFGIVFTQAALLIPQYILAEVTLSFLGLGLGEPLPTWGNMLASLQHYSVLASYWWMYIPGLLLIPMLAAFHTLASALHEKWNVGYVGLRANLQA